MTGILSSINEIGSEKCFFLPSRREYEWKISQISDIFCFDWIKKSLPFKHKMEPKTIISFIKSNGLYCTELYCECVVIYKKEWTREWNRKCEWIIWNWNEPEEKGKKEEIRRHFSISSSPPELYFIISSLFASFAITLAQGFIFSTMPYSQHILKNIYVTYTSRKFPSSLD